MKSIKIEGLRSIENSGFIELKPLTLLLGENSSGKSTFLRTFPLLRQSTESHTRGPLLWYGSYVDFGSFEDSLSNFAKDKCISFTFKIASESLINTAPKRYITKAGITNGDIDITLTVINDGKNAQTRVKSVKINHNENYILISYTKSNKISTIISNDIDLTEKFGEGSVLTERNNYMLFPYISYSNGEAAYRVENQHDNTQIIELISNLISEYADKRSNHSSITTNLTKQGTVSIDEFIKNFKSVSSTNTWRKKTDSIDKNSKNIASIHAALFSSRISWLIVIINIYISNELGNLNYIAPLRATAERFYRNQDLSVEAVDFQGKNLAMFIHNLSESKQNEYKSWLVDNFGFYIESISYGGHLSLRITYDGSDKSYNVTDMGFGFSQILPIITQLWFTSAYDNKPDLFRLYGKSNSKYLVIEQPELHLHPRFQAKMVDVFIKMINHLKESKSNLVIIVETHSETIINQIGSRIRCESSSDLADKKNVKNTIDKSDVSIVLFDKLSPNQPTEISLSGYDSNGNLTDWPWGFFEPEFDL